MGLAISFFSNNGMLPVTARLSRVALWFWRGNEYVQLVGSILGALLCWWNPCFWRSGLDALFQSNRERRTRQKHEEERKRLDPKLVVVQGAKDAGSEKVGVEAGVGLEPGGEPGAENPQAQEHHHAREKTLSKFDADMVVRHDVCWRWFFIVFVGGMGFVLLWYNIGAALEAPGGKGHGEKPPIRLAITVADQEWFEFKMPYLFVVFVAAFIDLKDFWNVLRWVIGLGWPGWFSPRFEFVASTNKLHIHNWPREEEIKLETVKELILITREHCAFIAATYVLGSLPFASLSLVMGYPFSREVGNFLGVMLAARSLFGTSWMIKIYYMLRYIGMQVVVCNSDLDDYRSEFAATLFDKESTLKNLRMGALWLGFIALPSFLFSYFCQVDALQWVPLVWLMLFSAGIGVSVTQQLPVYPTFFISVIDEGYYVRYHKQPEIAHGKFNRWWRKILGQEALLICFPKESSRFHDLIKGKPDPASDYDDEPTEEEQVQAIDNALDLLRGEAEAHFHAGANVDPAANESALPSSPVIANAVVDAGELHAGSPRGAYMTAPSFSPVGSPTRTSTTPVSPYTAGAPRQATSPLRLEDIELA